MKGYVIKKAIISDGLSNFAPSNIVLSNQFIEELARFASFYESNVIILVS
jgi:hypothetical protein